MPIPTKYLTLFQEDGAYHVFNRTNNGEKLFLSNETRLFFLKKYKEHLSIFLDTYCWCLLPNHFHLFVKIKSVDHIIAGLQRKEPISLSGTEKDFLSGTGTINDLILQAFKRFFQSYSLAFNKVDQRNGNLFYKPFKRILINKESQFTQLVVYIHANPLKHQLTHDFTRWEWSSWESLVSNQPTALLRKELLDWFGGIEKFVRTHIDMTGYYYGCDTSIED